MPLLWLRKRFIQNRAGQWRKVHNHRASEQAKADVLDWLSWYNTERLHSSIGYRSPNNFEAKMPLENAAKAA